MALSLLAGPPHGGGHDKTHSDDEHIWMDGFMIWMGPITPIIVLCHPDLIRTMANASGTHAELVVVGVVAYLRASSFSLLLLCGPHRTLAPPPLFSLSRLPLYFYQDLSHYLFPAPAAVCTPTWSHE